MQGAGSEVCHPPVDHSPVDCTNSIAAAESKQDEEDEEDVLVEAKSTPGDVSAMPAMLYLLSLATCAN